MAHSSRTWTGARTPQAQKRVRQALRRHDILQPRRSAAKTHVKNALVAAGAGDPEKARAAVIEAVSALDKAAKVGAIHPNAADRRKSRLMLRVNAAVGGDTIVATGKVQRQVSKAAATKAAKARIAAGKASKAKGEQTAAGKARAALSRSSREATSGTRDTGTTASGATARSDSAPGKTARSATRKATAAPAKSAAAAKSGTATKSAAAAKSGTGTKSAAAAKSAPKATASRSAKKPAPVEPAPTEDAS